MGARTSVECRVIRKAPAVKARCVGLMLGVAFLEGKGVLRRDLEVPRRPRLAMTYLAAMVVVWYVFRRPVTISGRNWSVAGAWRFGRTWQYIL